jgi:SAM-dependent methyltransferase
VISFLRSLAQRTLPRRVRAGLTSSFLRATRWPPVGFVDFGDLRRLRPVSEDWGYDRGTPIDRFYIEDFLALHRDDIRGRVVEIQDRHYTSRFGEDRVTRSDILHVSDDNPVATLVGDLTDAPHLPDAAFDCFILTQTLQFIGNPSAAVATAHRILAPGGVLLVTVPGVTKISLTEARDFGQYWHFTRMSLEALLTEKFGSDSVSVSTVGNVLSATGFLHGIAAGELTDVELRTLDPAFEVIVMGRAVKR